MRAIAASQRAKRHCGDPSLPSRATSRLSSEEVEAIRVYTTDPEVYSKVTAMQFEGCTCALIELLKEAIDKAALPEGVIACGRPATGCSVPVEGGN